MLLVILARKQVRTVFLKLEYAYKLSWALKQMQILIQLVWMGPESAFLTSPKVILLV